ncbi:F0F1 ATP synthase subunit C [Spiroplasma endosymbiont of Aspidapion aeneum]|uniref:F0F1 ATP synthase subunit C n=1 Tax=Spiroplasma endosymbiont of Aspidapion aeneum TaxID=3066276 RepID=UPI00313D1459
MLDIITMSAIFYANFAGELNNLLPVMASKTTMTDSGLALLGAGITGVGMVGASIGQGVVGAGACIAIGRNPEASKKITQVMYIMAGFAESGAIYALLIGILLMFVLS